MCHTDLHYREGGINDDFPFLLGHEAAGTVRAPTVRGETALSWPLSVRARPPACDAGRVAEWCR